MLEKKAKWNGKKKEKSVGKCSKVLVKIQCFGSGSAIFSRVGSGSGSNLIDKNYQKIPEKVDKKLLFHNSFSFIHLKFNLIRFQVIHIWSHIVSFEKIDNHFSLILKKVVLGSGIRIRNRNTAFDK